MFPALLAVTPLLAPVQTPAHEVIYSQITSSPTSAIPGVPGNLWDDFYEVRVSPSGNHWTLTATRNTSNSFDDLTVVDGNLLFIQDFTPLPWAAGQSWTGGWIDVNDSGGLVIASGSNNGVGPLNYVVQSLDLGNNWTIVQTEGDSAPGIPGGTYEFWLDPRVTASGLIGHRSDLLGTPNTEDEAQHFNGTLLTQKGVTVPGGQAGSDAVQSIDFHEFGLEISDDGAHWMTRAFVGPPGGSARRAVIYDGNVVIQAGVMIPGAGFTRDVDHVDGVHMTPDGTWFAWGRNEAATYRDWVVKNGTVIAQENQPIVPGSAENWASFSNFAAAFELVRGNSTGDTLVYGWTNTANGWALVRNGTDILMRQYDPIDLDGNGLFDDDVVISNIAEGSDWAANGDIYLICSLVTPTLGQLGDALIRFEIPGGGNGVGVPFCSPADANSTGVPTVMSANFGSGVESDLHLEVQNGPPAQFGYFLLGTTFADPGIQISNGHLCVSGAIGRFNVTGSVRNSLGAIDASGVHVNSVGTATSTGGTGYDVPVVMPITGSPSITPGSTWTFQFWHREAGGQSNFSNGLSVTF